MFIGISYTCIENHFPTGCFSGWCWVGRTSVFLADLFIPSLFPHLHGLNTEPFWDKLSHCRKYLRVYSAWLKDKMNMSLTAHRGYSTHLIQVILSVCKWTWPQISSIMALHSASWLQAHSHHINLPPLIGQEIMGTGLVELDRVSGQSHLFTEFRSSSSDCYCRQYSCTIPCHSFFRILGEGNTTFKM